MSGILGGSQTTKMEIPSWLQEPAIRAIQRGEDIAQIGYTPYSGPDVAAFTPAQNASFSNNAAAAQAFGMAAPSGTGMPAAQNFNGVMGYSSLPMYNRSVNWLQNNRPGQYNAITGMFIDPMTGQPQYSGALPGATAGAMPYESDADRALTATPSHAELTAQYGWGSPGLPGGYTGLGDMFNGGGPGASGPTYSGGGLLSDLVALTMAGGFTNPFQGSAAGLQQAGNIAGQTYNPQTLAGTDLSQYMNPYQQSVIDTTMSQLNDANRMALNGVSAQATGYGAFGGSRHGVADALTNQSFLDTSARTLAGLNTANYNNALGAAQFDIGQAGQNRQMDMAQASQLAGLSGQAFGMGQQLNQNLGQQGMMQQQMLQRLIDAARSQYSGFTGAPGQSLGYPLAAISGVPQPQSQTTSQNPGLLNIGSALLGLL